ncbi:putative ribonuclease H-like domain-containing protein [Tanacetum coccineum]
MWNSIQNGPYQRPMVVDPTNLTVPILELLSKMTEGNKKQYIADVRFINYLLQAIPNDIYNSVDACKNAKEMWERIKRLMHGSEITTHVRHSRLMDEFNKIAAKRKCGNLLTLFSIACNQNGARISGKGKIKTGKLDFDNVYFCKELKYNLFSVSQICDKKNNVLFTDTECLVLSSDFKLLDESQVLLRVPRKDNIYNVDLKSVVPTKGLTSLIAKATIDESNLWHRRLGHINFKNMNKLVTGNLVRVVTDDFSRFSWVFFLATKDETSGILKTFITGIENQLDHKVKVIRCDNGTEFKNSVMNMFCEMKDIKKEFSVARTPQQNGVAKRKNRTLIEAARTMLVDFKLPTTFWAEVVNTACYVLNRVLVIKPHNKTPYELIHAIPPLIDFMKPFGCPVTILNTRDHLGKFDEKADEGYFFRYFVISKAIRVFNKRTRIVEETLNIRFLKKAPNVKGNGPDWLFDIDSLSKSMNYVPVIAGNQTNGIARTKDNIVAGPKDSEEDAGMKPTEVNESGASDKGDEDDQDTRSAFERLLQQEKQTEHPNNTNSINTVSTPVSTAGPSLDNTAGPLLDNTTGTIDSTANAFEEHLFARLSPFKNAYALPHVPNVFSIDDTRIFGNSYDDVEEEVDMNNVDTSYTASDAPFTKFLKDHPQEQVIGNYDEVFAPVARIEAIRLFLAYASFKGFVVYQMDVKSAFLYVKIEEEVYVCQPPDFEDPNFPDNVYKVEKALYGLHQAPKAYQDKYVAEILKKFDFATVKTASTLIGTNKALVKDEEAEVVDVHLYRSMIRSLMYLTAFMPDIMFAVCACARFQVTPKNSHLHALKRIFRYLKGQSKLGLWYPRDSPFDLKAFLDSDYAGANLDRKSTTGGCQFLGKRLISWQCKKQTIVANFTTEAEFVAAANCVGTPRYLSLVVPLKKVGDKAVHKELGDRMERVASTASSLEAGQYSVNTFGSGEDSMQLMELMAHYTKLSALFWETASASTSENEEIEITATIDGRVKTITEASLRRHLKLEDADGISSLPNTEIFEQLALMGYASDSDKLTFQKGHFSPQWRFLIHTILHCLSPKKTAWEQFSSNIATAIICLATNRTFNFSKMIFEGSTVPVDSHHTPTSAPSTSQQPPTPPFMQTIHVVEEPATMPHDSSQLRVQSLDSDDGNLTLNELMVLYTTISKKVEDLQNDLKQTKFTYDAAYTKLILRVKKLEHMVKASKSRRRARVIISDNEEDLEDSYKQGRIIAEIYQNPSISLVQDKGNSWIQEDAEIQTRTSADTEILLYQEEPTELVEDFGSGEKGEKEISTADMSVSTSSAIPEVSTASVSTTEATLSIVIPEVSTGVENLVYIRRSAEKRKDKGKAIMKEDEFVQKKTKKQLEQERLSHEATIRLQEQVNEEERQRISRDAEIAKQLQEEINTAREEQKKSDLEKALELQKSFSKAEVRKNMCMYLKNQGGYKQSHLKGISYEDIRPIFEKVWDQNQSFVPKASEIEKEVMKRSGFDFQKPPAKRQKIEEVSGSVEEQSAGKEKNYWRIIRVGNHTEVYQVFEDMLKRFDRDDLEKLWDLVKKKFSSTEPTIDKEKRYMLDLLKGRLYDTCGVHHVSTERGHDFFMLVEKDYPLTRAFMTVTLVNKLQVDESLEMANELLRKIFYQVNHKFRGGLLGIKIFYKFILLIQLGTSSPHPMDHDPPPMIPAMLSSQDTSSTILSKQSTATRDLDMVELLMQGSVMSSASSAVTYTSVYTDSEPGRVFWGADDEEISEGGIPRVIVLGYDGLPIQPVAPPSPDYIPGPEDPQTPPVPQDEDEREPMFVQAHDPDYVPEPIYPEYIPLEDEHEFPAEEQPLPPVDSPTAESPGYVTESDPEEDPEEYEDDETEDGPVDYPMDGGDDGDDDDGDSSRDDANDEDEDDEDEEEEEEHLAPADSAIVVPVDEPVFPPEGTEPVIPPPSTDITIGARITVRPQTSISLPPEAEVERLLAMTTPSPSPPISLSPPSAGERLVRCMAPPAHSSPPPVPSPLLPSSGCPTQIQTLRIASTQALIDAVTVALPSPLLPPLPPSLYIPPPVDHRDDIPESEQPPRKRLCLSTLGSRYEIGEGIRDVGYGIRDTWVDPAEAVPEIAPMTVEKVNTRVTKLAELYEHDTQDLYALLKDAQDSRSRISQRVDMDSHRVDLLMGDRMTLQETVTHQELQTHRDHVYAHETHLQAHQTQLQLQGTLIQTQHQVHKTRFQMQHAEIAALRETDRRRQAQMVETLRVMRDIRREMGEMQTELLALRGQRRARQPAPNARIPDHQDASMDADSHV